MRDVALTIILLGILPLIFYRPHVGVLAWAWVSFINPHKEVYSYLQGANINFAIASLTALALIFSGEKWFPRPNLTIALVLIFAAWSTVTTYTAFDYDMASSAWTLNIKTFILMLFVYMLINNGTRIHALILVTVISLGYWGVTSAEQTIASFGRAQINGPPGA